MRKFDDIPAIRTGIFDNVFEAVRGTYPVENADFRLELAKLRWDTTKDFTETDRKNAILSGSSLQRKLRGEWRLVDKKTGKIVDKIDRVVAHVPYMTRYGTFVQNGNEYTIAHQMRLRPGVYTRIKANGELESHFNFLPGEGTTFRLLMRPDTGQMLLRVGQANVPLYSLLKALGITDKQLEQTWGRELVDANRVKDDPKAVEAALKHFNPKAVDSSDPARALADSLAAMRLDPKVTRYTLGREYTAVTPQALLDASRKLLAVQRGEADTDERDSLRYQLVYGPEDLFAERIRRDVGRIGRNLLYKSTLKRNVQHIPSGALSDQLRAVFLNSGLAQALEEVNPLDIKDQLLRISRLGEGGIPSVRAIPEEARSVQPSYLRYIDPVRGPECLAADMEIMTKTGWKRVTEVTDQDELACLIKGRLEYRKPIRWIAEHYEGPMYGADAENIKYLVTPGHRMWIRTPDSDEYKFEFADSIIGLELTFSCGLQADHEHQIREYFVEYYDGMVYCAEVPGGLIYVRRGNGCGFWTGNSAKIGVDLRVVYDVYKGKDGRLYADFINAKTGKKEVLAADDAADKVISFPGELAKGERYVRAMVRGRLQYVDRNQVDYEVPSPEQMFTLGSNLVPMIQNNKGRQFLMGGKMSVAGFEPVLIRRDGELLRIAIEDYEWQQGDETVGLDRETLKPRWMPILAKYEHENECDMVNVALERGHSVTLTAGHSFTVMRNGKLVDVCAADLEPDDKIPRIARLNTQCSVPMDINGTKLGADLATHQGGELQSGLPGEYFAAPYRVRRDILHGFVGTFGKWAADNRRLRDDLALLAATVGMQTTCGDSNHSFVVGLDGPADRDIAWERVLYIRKMDRKEYPVVYDLDLAGGTFMVGPGIIVHNSTQALPLRNAEAPHVQNLMPGTIDKSFQQAVGESLGAIRADTDGVVLRVYKDHLLIRDKAGNKRRIDLAYNLPNNRKTFLHQTPVVKPGDPIKKGQLLAYSNYTTPDGTAALGLNVRLAYLPFAREGGVNYEDACIVSESLAKRFTSEHMYTHELDDAKDKVVGRKEFLALFPSRYDREQLSKIDENGLVKPGSIVKKGDPLILAAKEREPVVGKLYTRRGGYTPREVTWEHEFPGIVTDVYKTKRGWQVAVKGYAPLQPGDKLCYDERTEVLTRRGWIRFPELSAVDRVAVLDPETGEWAWEQPKAIHRYDHFGPMVHIAGPIDLLVTDEHRLWTKVGDGWAHARASECIDVRIAALRAARQVETEETVELEGFKANHWAVLYGAWLAAGLRDNFYCVAKLDDPFCNRVRRAATGLGLRYKEYYDRIVILSRELAASMAEYRRELPEALLRADADTAYAFVTALPHEVRRLDCAVADTIQRVAAVAGVAVDVFHTRHNCRVVLADTVVECTPRRWRETYDGSVYCCEVSTGVFLVRRNGKPVWCGNSGRVGNKATVAAVVPDERMPKDKKGRPIELLLGPEGIVTRGNPSQVHEALLGKIVEKTGKPYILPSFDKESRTEFVRKELAKHGISDREDLVDPDTGRKIPKVLTGVGYFMKLHHTAEAKASGRGDIGAYTSEEAPSRGGEEGSKRIGNLALMSLMSHNAVNVLRDAKLVRGQRNDEYWKAFRMGYPPPTPSRPFVYDKFIAMLQASGINVEKKGDYTHLMALTDQDTLQRSGGEIKNSETVDYTRNMKPIPGGLFDEGITGGPDGRRWAHIKLAVPLPNPVMEEPIRRILGLTKKEFEAVLRGEHKLRNGMTGAYGMYKALQSINVDEEIKRAQSEIKSKRGSARDAAIKRLGYYMMCKEHKIHPKQFMWTVAPVLPPAFRPISKMKSGGKDIPLVADANALYKDLLEANDVYKKLVADLGPQGVGNERVQLYRALKAVAGLGDPISAETREKGVRGLLVHIFGKGSPKTGLFQRRLLGVNVNVVGRGVIVPNPALDMDHVGLPETRAWEIYRPIIMRKLALKGMAPADAADAIIKKTQAAKDALNEALKEYPVIINRAPSLHRYSLMAAWPILVKGDELQISPLVTPGFNADFNGDSTLSDVIPLMITIYEDGKFHKCENQRTLTRTFMHLGTFEEFIRNYIYPEYEELEAVNHLGKQTTILPVAPEHTVRTLGLDDKGNPVWAKVKAISIHTSHGPDCYRIKTKMGMDCIFTAHHNVWILNNDCELVPAKTDALSVGGLIPYVVGFELPENGRPINVPNEFDLNYENGLWFGHFLADGSLTGRHDTISQSSTDRKLLDHLAEIGDKIILSGHWYEGNGYSVRWTSKKWHDFMRREFGSGAANKKIPGWALFAPKDFKLGMIAGYLLGEGNVDSAVRVECVNRRLLLVFRFLLNSFGVFSSVRPGRSSKRNRSSTWVLRINKQTFGQLGLTWPDSVKSAQFIGGVYKTQRQTSDRVPFPYVLKQKLLSRGKDFVGGRRRTPRKAKVPDYKQLQRAFKLGYCTRKFANAVIDGYKLREVNDKCIQNWINLVDNVNLAWDIIEYMRKTKRPDVTYDLSVEGKEAFSIDGSFLTHNTMNYHVPIDPEARKEAIEKLLPSKNLISVGEFDVHYVPRHAFLQGLWFATSKKNRKEPRVFRTESDAIAAYKRGEIGLNDPVVILNDADQTRKS